MDRNYYAVIMAGGSGTRLWPLSRKDHPKQSLKISGGKSLFQHAVNRLLGLFTYEEILIVTVADQVDILKAECPEIPLENFIIEPLPRGTASVVGLAAIAIKNRDENASMAILTADHLIDNELHLRQLLKAAYDVAQEEYLVTLGITPTYPATGYGYIQKGEKLGEYQDLNTFAVEKFKEKPDAAQAKVLFDDGEHVWNSGMFIWQVGSIMAEFEHQMPNLSKKLNEIDKHWLGAERFDVLQEIWPTIKPKTIDYGIMENASNVAVIPANNLGWYDVGSWESLFEALEGDDAGNIVLQGDSLVFDTQGTLICEDSSDRLIVTIGVEDLIIIDSGKAVLVCDRKHAQYVREVVQYLKEHGREDYL